MKNMNDYNTFYILSDVNNGLGQGTVNLWGGRLFDVPFSRFRLIAGDCITPDL